MRIHFVLVCEGSSDEGLIPHLENLCIELGAYEVTGTALDFQRLEMPVRATVQAKLMAALQLEPTANLFFIHRDADDRDPASRLAEISLAVERCRLERAWVPIVPIQATEAWLLLDERAIRTVAGRPNGRSQLNLPSPRQVENIAGPKEKLKEVLVQASELTGRRLVKFRKNFPSQRRLLLQRLPNQGVLAEVRSWVNFRSELDRVVQDLGRDGEAQEE